MSRAELLRSPNSNLIPLTEKILSSGQITYQQHFQLTYAMLSNVPITSEESTQINRVFERLQTGQLKIVEQ
jgi:hypothetical protein